MSKWVRADSSSINQALAPEEDLSLSNLISSTIDGSADFLPFSLFYKSKVGSEPNQASEKDTDNHKKVKRYKQPGQYGGKVTQVASGVVPSRFSPDSRPVPRTPNLVLDETATHLELEARMFHLQSNCKSSY